MARQRAIRPDDPGRNGGPPGSTTLRAPHLLRGATGSGKTTSALRAAAGRVFKDHSALFFVDQKGDPHAEVFLRNLATAMDVPFILFDRVPTTAITGSRCGASGQRPAEVVARVLAGRQTSEPYYADVLRKHVGIVASVLHIAGYWPPSFPLLVEASQVTRFDRIQTLAAKHSDTHPELWRRVQTHAGLVASSEGHRALAGGLTRLDLVIGEAWRSVLTPRIDPTGQPVGVSLTHAITDRAVVLWRTHVDLMPDEAQTITALILNDIHASAVEAQTGGPARWTCVLDEFGAVVATAADQALALLQRGRTHEGQVLVVTQSIADIEALTGQPGLLASMADNFAGFIIHRQSAPESRDWLAKLMGTTALWQSTDQTSCHAATGAGSRRRVREFRISSDTFSELRVGEAVIHTTLGPPPTTCQVQPLQLCTGSSPRRITSDERSACEILVHPAAQLPIGAPPAEGATTEVRSPSADKPTTADQRGEVHTAYNARHGETAPRQRPGPAQSFDDA
jgi:TraM recognition site of TraD and TraG